MSKVSPIAEYLRINKAIPKHDKNGCHFVSPEGLYLGVLRKHIVNNYKVISLDILGDSLKKMYTKSVAYGQQFAYIKNNSSPLGVSLVPIKTYMRKIYVDFVHGTKELIDTEKSLINKLDLIAADEATGVGLYDMEKPFMYNTEIKKQEHNNLKNPIYKFITH